MELIRRTKAEAGGVQHLNLVELVPHLAGDKQAVVLLVPRDPVQAAVGLGELPDVLVLLV